MSSIVTPAEAVALWPDADTMPQQTLQVLLDAAWEACLEYLPAEQVTTPPAPVPQRWLQANVLQARDLWTAYRREGDVIGFDQYAVRVQPVSATVRALLRPPRGVPGVA